MTHIALAAARMHTLAQVRENLRDHDLVTYAEHFPDVEPALGELQSYRDNNEDSLSDQVNRLEEELQDERDDNRALRFTLGQIEGAVSACHGSTDDCWDLAQAILKILKESEV